MAGIRGITGVSMISTLQKTSIGIGATIIIAAILTLLFFPPSPPPIDTTENDDTDQPADVVDTTTPLTDNGSAAIPTIYVSIVTHNEEPDGTAIHPDFTKDEAVFWEQREAVVAFADMLYDNHVGYNWQSDWNFLTAVTMFDKGTPSTSNKNVVQYLAEDLNMSIGPHAHESTHTYADVAALIAQLGVTPNGVVGGFLLNPPNRSKLEYLRSPIKGDVYDYTWTPTILWGGGSPGHRADPEVSGVWRPTNTKNYYTHDNNGTLPDVGTYLSTWEGIDDLLALQAAGKLTPGLIYTSSVMITQEMITNDDALTDVQAHIDALKDEIADGRVVFVDIETVVKIWEERYDSVPNVYRAN